MAGPDPLVTVGAAVLGGAALLGGLATAVFLGRPGVTQLLDNLRTRPRETLWPFGLLGGILVVNDAARDVAPEVSRLVGINITGAIYAAEGAFVAHVQSIATPALTAVLSATYLSGYVVLLAFPLVAYAALSDLRPLERAAVAVSVNYAVGLVLYALFISYGPRNMLPDLVSPLLYEQYPWSKILTGQVNTNTNVFPSLHTSLSVTVAVLSIQTREQYPYWPAVAIPVAAMVVFSTMYLGIHWATDVVAGALLGVGSVAVANRWRRSPSLEEGDGAGGDAGAQDGADGDDEQHDDDDP